jgi:hypothetical protein
MKTPRRNVAHRAVQSALGGEEIAHWFRSAAGKNEVTATR